MHRLCLPLLATILLAGGMATPARANPQACADLWIARDEIYKAQGYCFRTKRAIAAFGNAGCQYDNVEDLPLSAHDHRVIADILRQEHAAARAEADCLWKAGLPCVQRGKGRARSAGRTSAPFQHDDSPPA